jgi:single-stranded-DNA-specific exonuclease
MPARLKGPKWLPKCSQEEIAQLELGEVPSLIGRILFSKGYRDPQAIHKLLNPKLAEIQDPFRIEGMKVAADRLLAAYHSKEPVCVYADFDLDGSSGLALMVEGLTAMGFTNVIPVQPKRLSEGYGFHIPIVEDLVARGVRLIVTVDVGITSVETCARARELGVDVIVTDHHLPGEVLPPAFVIINPNQKTDQSNLGYLSGAGVAFYLLRAIKRALHDQGIENSFDLRSVLDFLTIATITDMVPLIADNRALVKAGLAELERTRRPGLRALLEKLNLSGTSLNAQDVALKFAPKLNALSRLELQLLPINLYLEKDHSKAEEMVETILNNNAQRVDLQAQADQRARENLKDWDNPHFVFTVDESFHKGVVGLVATKLSQLYNRPAFVGAVTEGTIVSGSARIPNGYEGNLVTALSSCATLMNRFGGHAAAAGFEFSFNRFEEIKNSLTEHFLKLEQEAFDSVLEYDVEASIRDIDHQIMNGLTQLGPFGTDFDIPILKFLRLRVSEIKTLKGGHFRLKLEEQNKQLNAILFSPSERQKNILDSRPSHLDVLAELQWNSYNGRRTIQLNLRDLRISEEIIVEGVNLQ